MIKYTIKRLLQSLLTVFIVVTIVFLLLRMMPTDYYFTEDELIKLTDEQKEDKLRAAGLLDPTLTQLRRFYGNLLHGDLGDSRRISNGQSVISLIGEKFHISMRMGLIALGIALLIGIPMGILQARYKNGIFDHLGTAYTIFINAVPRLVAYSLIYMLGVKLFKLPSMYSIRDPFRSSILPVICLAVGSIASYALWMRRYMVDDLTKDYIKLARIKGVSTRGIMFKHVMRNAFVPMAQNLPTTFLLTIGGSLLVESFFAVPGMGPLLTRAITRYDTNVVQGLVLLYSALGILGMFLGDLLMSVFDPRIRLTGKGGETR